jgi:hypothetical protein
MSISTYFRPNIHQSTPKILGVKGHFTLGVKTKETQELNNPIGGKIKIGPKGFILGVKFKVFQNDLAPMWHYFGAIFSLS